MDALAAARTRLADSNEGRRVLAEFDALGVPVDVASSLDAVPGSAGYYDAELDRVVLGAASLDDTEFAALLLAHEMTHAIDIHRGAAHAQSDPPSSGSGPRFVGHEELRSELDATHKYDTVRAWEPSAWRVEARVAEELQIDAPENPVLELGYAASDQVVTAALEEECPTLYGNGRADF